MLTISKKSVFILSFLISLAAHAQVVDTDLGGSKAWKAMTFAQDAVWQKPSCVATVMGDDDQSNLEVISFFDSQRQKFTEPMIHVITPYDVRFFEVELSTSSSAGRVFSLLPVQLPQAIFNGVEMVGARALIDDREDLVRLLRVKNSVTARYLDAQGEVKSLRFSLSGSSVTINTMFDACDLQFSDLVIGNDLPLLD